MPAAAPGTDELRDALHGLGHDPVRALLAGGALATWVGLRETIVVGASAERRSFLWLLFSPQRHLREMPEPVTTRALGRPTT